MKWCNVLKHIINVVLFLGEPGLAFSGSSQRIGDPSNGSFLDLSEQLSTCDPMPQELVKNAKDYQEKGDHLQVHYLPPESQSELIFYVC